MPMQGLRVTEIFYSIQGESTRAGLPCVFVRLTGCPMRCVWCDTAYAFEGGRILTPDAIMDEIRTHACRLVEITGGEPLAQRGVHSLVSRLLDDGYMVLIETGGGVPVAGVDPRAVLVYDIKCPDSGEVDANHWPNLDHLKPGIDEIKLVLASRRDYVWAVDLIRSRGLAERHTVLFSPAHGLLDPKQLSEWILQDALPVRLQLPLHKMIWGSDVRGV
jgi:7-carboxy-7-deazaguanine synthase